MYVPIKRSGFNKEYERIFERYLDVCNQALERNKNVFPFREIWAARIKNMGQQTLIQCAVYDDRPKIIYTLQLTEDLKIKVVKKESVLQNDAWPLKFSYLKEVVDNPKEYIEHPANLDWGWLTGILG